jgi:TonB family protein
MRRVLGAALFGLAVAAGAALAQTTDVNDPILVYRSRPSIETMMENYPNTAYGDRREGYAELCCLVRENGTLACAVIGESPAGYGFGEAARRVASEIRLTEQSAIAVRQRGQPLRVPINFRQARFEPAPRLESQARCGAPTSPAPQPQTEPLVSAQG